MCWFEGVKVYGELRNIATAPMMNIAETYLRAGADSSCRRCARKIVTYKESSDHDV